MTQKRINAIDEFIEVNDSIDKLKTEINNLPFYKILKRITLNGHLSELLKRIGTIVPEMKKENG